MKNKTFDTLAGALGFWIMATTALAADLSSTVALHIAAQPLASALLEFSAQAQIQIVTAGADVRNLRAAELDGKMTVGQALEKLLNGSGLTFRMMGDSTIGLVRESDVRKSTGDPRGEEKALDSGAPGSPADSAQVQQGHTPGTVDVEQTNKQASDRRIVQLEEVVVTGSRLARTAAEGTQEVKVYNAKQIERSGQATVADFLDTLPEVSTSVREMGGSFQTGFGQTSVQLHGMPLGTTLVLLDGRQVESGGTTVGKFFDLNSIPVAAIDRIEVEPEAASAVYGSNALAGVVNVILKKDFDGAQIDAHYGAAIGIDEKTAALAWGKSWSRGSISVVGSYLSRGELTDSERAITANSDYSQYAQLGGKDTRVTLCSPGTVYSAGSGNLPGLSSSQAAIPSGLSGAPTLQDFVTGAGATNKCSRYAAIAAIPPTERSGVFVTGNYRLAGSVELFTELMYSHVQEHASTYDAALSKSTLSAANPFNPFGATVRVDAQIPDSRQSNSTAEDYFRPLVGIRGGAPNAWNWEVAGWQSQDIDHNSLANQLNSGALSTALASSDPAFALNPFSPQGLASQVQRDNLLYNIEQRYDSRLLAVNGFLRGPLFTLPSGRVEVVVGSEYDREDLSGSVKTLTGTTTLDYQRHESSIFGEVRVPILASRAHSQAGEMLAFTTAVRYDRYSDFGGHVTPQYGVEFRPVETLLLRGSYAEAFGAPTLAQSRAPQTSYTGAYTFVDPRRGGSINNTATVIFGGNSSLDPQTGRSKSLGVVWSPRAVRELRASVTWWNIEQQNRVANVALQTLIDNESEFSSRITRAPSQNGEPGVILSVDNTYVNFGTLEASGFSLDLNYGLQTPYGHFAPSLSVVEFYQYEAAVTPGAPLTDRLAQANTDAWAPRWKGTLGLGWGLRNYTANLSARYVGSYLDYQTPVNTNKLGDFVLYDLNVGWDIGKTLAFDRSWLAGLRVSGGAVNLCNSLPKYSNFASGVVGYDPSQYDIRGRFLYLNVSTRF